MSTDDYQKIIDISDRFAANVNKVASGGGGGHSGGMEERLAKLEARADTSEQRLGRMEITLDRLTEKVGGLATKDDVKRLEELPTRDDLHSWKRENVGIGLTIIILVFGGISVIVAAIQG